MLVPLIFHCTSGQGSEATSTTTVTLGVPESATVTVPSIRSLAAVGLVAVRSVTTGDSERNKIMTDDYMQSLMTTAHIHTTAQSCIGRGIKLGCCAVKVMSYSLLINFSKKNLLQQYGPGVVNHCVVEYYNQIHVLFLLPTSL